MAIRLLVAHEPWSVNFVAFQQHLLFSHSPHITVPILAFQRAKVQEAPEDRAAKSKLYGILSMSNPAHAETRPAEPGLWKSACGT